MKTKIFIILLLFSSQICAQTKVIMVWGDSLLLIKKKVVSDEFSVKDSFSIILSNGGINKLEKQKILLIFIGHDFHNANPNFSFKYNPIESPFSFFYTKNPEEGIFEYYDKQCLSYIDPLPDGKWYLVSLADNGKYEIQAEKSIKDEFLHGEFIDYYKNEIIKGYRNYLNGYPDSIVTFYNSGAILLQGKFLNNCNKYKHFKSFYESGEISSIFEHSILKQINFFKSGNISEIINIDWYGIPEGEARRYDESGKLVKKIYYKEGRALKEETVN